VYTVETAKKGNRNDTLFWTASPAREMADAGEIGTEAAAAFLRSAAVAAGLPEQEARRTVASAMGGTR
jgi:hypothetical protein